MECIDRAQLRRARTHAEREPTGCIGRYRQPRNGPAGHELPDVPPQQRVEHQHLEASGLSTQRRVDRGNR